MVQVKNNATLNAASCVDEAGLLLRVARQDWRAFEQLYRAYYPRITRFLDKMLRHGNLVDEILDDTMLVVWQRANTFNGQSRVSTWIFAIAYHKALKALEREGRHGGIDGAPDDVETSQALTDEHDLAGQPDAQLMALQSRQMVDHLLMQLPAEQRAVIELTYYHGCAYKEIAAIAGCPVDTVKTRMFHARRKLRLLIPKGAPF